MFGHRSDAVAWSRINGTLRAGEWLDPCRGQVPLSVAAEMWLESQRTVKRRTLESDRGTWRTTSLRGSRVDQWHQAARQTSRAGSAT